MELAYPVAGPDDFYSFTLDADSSATLALTSLTGSSLGLELIDSTGAPLAIATHLGTNVDEGKAVLAEAKLPITLVDTLQEAAQAIASS